MKREKGITLIALVITIIILIILAGIGINLVLGNNGIITKTQNSNGEYNKEKAREKLEIELSSLYMEKQTDEDYNEEEYLTNRLMNKNFFVNGNIVIVEGYKFQIDRSVPKIVTSLGNGEENQNIKISTSNTIYKDYTKSVLKVEIEYNNTIQEIRIGEKNIEIPEKQDDKYTIEVDIEKNGMYNIYVRDENNGYKIVNVKIEGISEDLKISSVESLVNFRDAVNNGATFEGKTITLLQNIDLSSVCSKDSGVSWIPIGTSTNKFKGTFDGNYHKISNLYINTNSYTNLGFFSETNGTIKNLVMENIYVYNSKSIASVNTCTGGIVGKTTNATISNCATQSGSIFGVSSNSPSSNYRWTFVGGIVGEASSSSMVENCYNKAYIKSQTPTGQYCCASASGIVGRIYQTTVKNCYNRGTIYAYSYASARAGIIGYSENTTNIYNYIINCYNAGTISGGATYRNRPAGIVSKNGWDTTKANTTITNSYCLNNVSYSYYYQNTKTSKAGIVTKEALKTYDNILGDAFVKDEKIINDDLPILKWQNDYENIQRKIIEF